MAVGLDSGSVDSGEREGMEPLIFAEIEPLNAAWTSILGTGVVGALLVISVFAIVHLIRRMEARCEERETALVADLRKKDEKLTAVMETTLANNTAAMHDNANATRENTKVLQNVPCVKNFSKVGV